MSRAWASAKRDALPAASAAHRARLRLRREDPLRSSLAPRASRLAGRALLFTLALAALITGCAPMTKTTAPAQAAPPAPVPAKPAAQAPPPAAAVVDSGPTPEALSVLADIPEPVADASEPGTAAGATDAGAGAVPVPAPTTPLGDVAGAAVPVVIMTADSTSRATAAPDTCWRVQLAATSDATKARRFADAASSLLLQPAEVEHEGKLLKVRVKGCETKQAAEALKRRAVDAGFAGAFIFPGKRAP